MLKTNPETVHLAHVLEDEFDGVVDVAAFAFKLIAFVWQDIFHHFEQVIAKEETPSRLLNAFDHIQQVAEDQLDGGLLRLDIGRTHCDKQVETGDNGPSVLHRLVKVTHVTTLLLLLHEMRLKECQLIKDHHIYHNTKFVQSADCRVYKMTLTQVKVVAG